MSTNYAVHDAGSGEVAMARLADRLATLAPPAPLALSRMQAFRCRVPRRPYRPH